MIFLKIFYLFEIILKLYIFLFLKIIFNINNLKIKKIIFKKTPVETCPLTPLWDPLKINHK